LAGDAVAAGRVADHQGIEPLSGPITWMSDWSADDEAIGDLVVRHAGGEQ
jgi:hypothetical protein